MRHPRKQIHQAARVATIFIFLFLSLSPALPVQAAAAVFVTPNGTGDCSQLHPCNLATGLASVDDEGTLYAGAGIYEGTGDQVVLISRTIYFYGGWNGASTGTPERDPATYVSIIEGMQERRGIAIKGGSSVHPTVDGWTIRNGNATGTTAQCAVSYDDTASGCGGGIYVYQAEPYIYNNIIHANTAAISESSFGGGGGIYIHQSAGTLVRWNQIYDNDSHINGEGFGGGIYIHNSGGKTTVMDNEIYSNEGSSTSYYSHQGAGLSIFGNTGQVQIFMNNIHGNNPNNESYSGGAIHTQYCDNTLLIDENLIVDNFGDSAINIGYSAPTIQQNTIINPESSIGLRLFGLFPVMPVQSVIVNNNIIASNDSRNIEISGNSGAPIVVDLIHNTLSHSHYGIYVEFAATVNFDRGIVSNHETAGIYITTDPEISLTVTNTLFHDNISDPVTGTNPLSGDPLYHSSTAGNFHIRRGSAAIDRVTDGGIAEDIDDDDRPMGTGGTPYDVGADEFCSWYDFFLPLIIRP